MAVCAGGGLPGASNQPTPQSDYWCAMHPDVRGSKGDKCPRCGMPLVPAPPSSADGYHLDIEVVPRAPVAGGDTLVRLSVRHPQTGTIVREFEESHERLLHLFVIGHDLEFFAHLHPVRTPDGAFEQHVSLPRSGAYRLIADVVPAGGAPQLLQRSIVTAGYRGRLLPIAAPPVDLADKTVNGVRVKAIVPQPVGGREQLMTFELADVTTGRPVDDLEPFLGAPAHLLIASGDLESVTHSHPVAALSDSTGPRVVFQVLFPRAGSYRAWVQFQRHGEVLTAPFTVEAKRLDPGASR
jgi:heavy metal-binding protein